ncbi:MAG: alpha/beta fold hydrolase [Pseudomonadota bacterium]
MQQAASPSPLVLLPGMMCDQRLWSHQRNSLARYAQVLCPSYANSASVSSIAKDLLTRLPRYFSLAGLSMGGIVAFEILRQAPERVLRLALLDTNYRADAPERRAVREQQIEQVRSGGLARVLREELKPNYLASAHRSNGELLDQVLAMGLDLGVETFVAQSLALRDRQDSTDTLASIHCSTLVLCGKEDSLCPVELHAHMAAQIKKARLIVVPDCGHLSPMEQPALVNRELKLWLHST